MAASSVATPCHELRWDPHTAYEFVSVGDEMTVCFWLVEEMGSKCKLKVIYELGKCYFVTITSCREGGREGGRRKGGRREGGREGGKE